MKEKELGQVKSVRLTMDRGSFIGLWINFKFKGSEQSMGGIVLCEYNKEKNRRVGTAAGLDYIIQVMSVFDVEDSQKIIGKFAWVFRNNGIIEGFEVVDNYKDEENKTFMIDKWRKEWYPETEN